MNDDDDHPAVRDVLQYFMQDDDKFSLKVAVVASRMALHIMANAIAEMSDGKSHPTRDTLELWDKVITETLCVLDAVDPDLSDLYDGDQSNKPH